MNTFAAVALGAALGFFVSKMAADFMLEEVPVPSLSKAVVSWRWACRDCAALMFLVAVLAWLAARITERH